MKIPFEFTNREFEMLLDAVRHAREDAISSAASAGFNNVHHELIRQHDEWQESENYGAFEESGGDDGHD